MDFAGKMGIDQDDLSFDNIDMLRDLEIARAALNNPVVPVIIDSNENLEEILPFSENNIEG
jgi:PII-like signaling protein